MLDGYGADPRKLDDASLLFETLDALPELIGMRKLGSPVLARVKDPEGYGISGIIMIHESHISLHTYPKKEFLSMDVYSCKGFDAEHVIEEIKRRYGVHDAEVNLVERAKRFPQVNLHP
jgi:S-adenosylmethionine decarboxylase